MAKRVVIAGILGGVAMFVWLFVAHEFLPLGEMGVGEIPNEAAVLAAMRSALPQGGLYLFPGFGLGPNATSQQRKEAMPAYTKKYEQSPHGILIYHPASGAFPFGAALARGPSRERDSDARPRAASCTSRRVRRRSHHRRRARSGRASSSDRR